MHGFILGGTFGVNSDALHGCWNPILEDVAMVEFEFHLFDYCFWIFVVVVVVSWNGLLL